LTTVLFTKVKVLSDTGHEYWFDVIYTEPSGFVGN